MKVSITLTRLCMVAEQDWIVVESRMTEFVVMSADDRLQALEQLVAVMQGEVLNARPAAAQAEQPATDAQTRSLALRGEGVVDTRVAGKAEEL